MEIFSNIWNILTTENEFLTKLIVSPTVIIEAWLVFHLFTSILAIRYNKKEKLIYIISFSVVSLLAEFLIKNPFNIFINYITMFIILRLILKQNIIKSILSIIIPTVIFALVGIIILKPLLLFFNISTAEAQSTPLYEILYLFILYFILLLLIKIIDLKRIKLLLTECFNKRNKKIILINLFLGFFTIGVQLAITAFYTDVLPIFISFLSFISLLTYFFISFYSLNKTMQLQIKTQDLENAESYNTTLSYLYDNVKAFKHDFDNMVFIIGGYVETNDLDGLKKYYKSLEKDCEKVNELTLLNPELINNSGIYNLLISKFKKAKDNNIEIHLEYFFDLNKLKMPIYDFSRMFGIFVDNALEAAKDSEEKQISIMFRDSQRNNTQIISIENSYNNKDVDTSNIFEKGNTSKENHTGMGLWEVKQILNRNNNVNLITTKDKIYFKQSIEIYY